MCASLFTRQLLVAALAGICVLSGFVSAGKAQPATPALTGELLFTTTPPPTVDRHVQSGRHFHHQLSGERNRHRPLSGHLH